MIPSRKIRLGQIDFTNVWPVFHYFPFALFDSWLEVVSLPPTGLNKLIANKKIDIAPISSFAYAELSDQLVLMPHLSVSAATKVKSILLFHKVPLDQLDGKSISLTDSSATSVHLLKIILERFVGVKPIYRTDAPRIEDMMSVADACLLIGDDAIKASWENQEDYIVTDLAEVWHACTGYGMTFAVWAVRKDLLATHEHEVTQIYEAFVESKRKGKCDLAAIIERAQLQLGGSETYWQDYFTTLTYDFDQQQQLGLTCYYQYAYELGLLEKPVQLTFWNKS